MGREPDMEELAAYSAGDLDPERATEIEAHAASCDACRERLAALGETDVAVKALLGAGPPASVVLRVRRRLSEELRGRDEPEIMTLRDVAEFLRVSLDDVGEMLDELPAFEFAGEIRVRRATLVEWIAERERTFARNRIESEVAHLIAPARRPLRVMQRR